MPTLREQLLNLPMPLRSAQKAAWHVADVRPRIGGTGYTWTRENVVITVTAANAEGSSLEVILTATLGGVPIFQGSRFLFTNPPVSRYEGGVLVETIETAFVDMVEKAIWKFL